MTETERTVVGPGIELPDLLVQRWRNFHGDATVTGWLDGLPALLDTWCERYRIDILPGTPPITYNLVLFGESPAVGDVVLKLSPPSPETASEIEALRQAAGHGMVRLIDADETASIMVLERIEPGTMLYDLVDDDAEATRIGADTMLRFWRAPARPDNLHQLEDWSRALLHYDPAARPNLPEIPADLIQDSVALGRNLIATQRDVTLLHGDVHHQNILWGGERGWVTIDPKGLIGERGYEIGTWMMNKWGFPLQENFLELANRRLDIFADVLNEDRDRLVQWSVFHATLSLCWTLEDDQPADITDDLGFVRNMMRLLP
jgi:streptomycin 6-kinase